MKTTDITIRPIGNSLGIVIPKPFLLQLGLQRDARLSLEGDALVIRAPKAAPRAGWAEAAQAVAAAGDDALVLGHFDNAADAEWVW